MDIMLHTVDVSRDTTQHVEIDTCSQTQCILRARWLLEHKEFS